MGRCIEEDNTHTCKWGKRMERERHGTVVLAEETGYTMAGGGKQHGVFSELFSLWALMSRSEWTGGREAQDGAREAGRSQVSQALEGTRGAPTSS